MSRAASHTSCGPTTAGFDIEFVRLSLGLAVLAASTLKRALRAHERDLRSMASSVLSGPKKLDGEIWALSLFSGITLSSLVSRGSSAATLNLPKHNRKSNLA